MGTQWFRGQLGLTLQQKLTRRRTGRHRVGGPSRMKDEMSPDVKDVVRKRITVFYKTILPKD